MSISVWLFLAICLKLHDDVTPEVCDDFFTQLSGCPVDFAYPATAAYQTAICSLLDCSRRCAASGHCKSFNHHTSKLNQGSCELVDVQATECQKLHSSPGARYYQKIRSTPTPNCTEPWKLALHQNKGYTTLGQISDLIANIARGSQVRVLVDRVGDGNSDLWMATADSVIVKGDNVFAYVFTWTPDFLASTGLVEWTRVVVNTTGWMANYTYYSTSEALLVDAYWFVKNASSNCPSSSSVVFAVNTMHEDVLLGSVDDLITAINDGYPVQMLESPQDDALISYPVAWTSIDVSKNRLELHAIWLDEMTTNDVQNQVRFASGIVTFTIDSNISLDYSSGIDVMNSSMFVEMMLEHYFPNVAFAVDFCWEKIYVNDENGDAVFGDLSTLQHRMISGHDIRVAYRCLDTTSTLTFNVERLSRNDDVLTAHVSDAFSVTDTRSADWIRREIRTNGTVSVVSLSLRDGNTSLESCPATVSWFTNKANRLNIFSYRRDGDPLDTPPSVDMNAILKGYLPRVVVLNEEDNSVMDSSSIQKFTGGYDYDSGFFYAYVFNYRCFRGNMLIIRTFSSVPFAKSTLIDFSEKENMATIDEIAPFSLDWYG